MRWLAAYFSEHPEAPVRIEIPPGSYHAEFCFRPPPANGSSSRRQQTQRLVDSISDDPPAGARDSPLTHVNFPAISVPEARNVPNRWFTGPRLVLAATLVLVIAGAWLWGHQREYARQDFWWPVLGSDQPALILVGRSGATVSASGQPAETASTPSAEADLALDDAIVTAQICSAFREYKLQCKVASASSATVEDIHGKSLAMVGGFNNQWTRRLLAPLPYQVQFNSVALPVQQRIRMIVEHKPTGDVALGTIAPGGNPSAEFSKDYSIVARFHSDITDGMAVVVAGLGRPGTASAGQYVNSPEKLREILALAPKGWAGNNFEAVLETDVVQGSSGHVKVIAARFW